ncbi:hypothetical protein MHYP_G00314770 [Metynnis hypsauchen]
MLKTSRCFHGQKISHISIWRTKRRLSLRPWSLSEVSGGLQKGCEKAAGDRKQSSYNGRKRVACIVLCSFNCRCLIHTR